MRRLLLLSAALLLATAAAFEGAAETYEYDDIDGNVEPDDAAASNANSSEMPPYPETIGDFVKLASDVGKGPAGECAVGLSCGAAAGWIVRRVQGALVATAIVSAIGTGAMLHLGWVTPETVRRRRRRAARALGYAEAITRHNAHLLLAVLEHDHIIPSVRGGCVRGHGGGRSQPRRCRA